MATATKPKAFNHEETQRRVRSPLQAVRAIIRRYIILEGLALTLLAAVGFFWVSLAFDFGLFMLDIEQAGVHGIDWILSLNDLDPSGNSSVAVRVIFLIALIVGLVALGFYKVGMRWFREFNDRAVALVLERRFPKQLGDRLITAVELADPKLAKRYGYSQAMVEKTIVDCVNILKTLPVSGVFNWRRLYALWLGVAALTFGLLLVIMLAFCAGSLATETPMGPYAFGWKFFQTGSIWAERNVAMMNTYWPRRAYIDVIRFQPSALDPNDMRVPLSDDRPALVVKAYEWVIADRDARKAPYGWRALTWKDLSEHNIVDANLLARVQIAQNFGHWQVDPEELEPNRANAIFGADMTARTSGKARAELDALKGKDANDHNLEWEVRRAIKAAADPAGAEELRKWLDWTEWTVDKISQEKEDKDNVRPELRVVVNGQDQFDALEAVFEQLEERAAAPSMARTIRKLDVPEKVHVKFVGAESGYADSPKWKEGNRYEVPLNPLKDSPKFRFRVRGDNYFTKPKTITLVASPSPAGITIDKNEPAYIYHRLFETKECPDQSPLKGLRHQTRDLSVPTTGDTNTIEVPQGSDLSIHLEFEGSTVHWGGLVLRKLTPTQRARLEVPANVGMLVTSVERESAAEKATLQVRDVIVRVNAIDVPSDPDAFVKLVQSQAAGKIVIAVQRVVGKDAKITQVPVEADMPPVKYAARKLREERALTIVNPQLFEPGYDGFKGEYEIDADRLGFTLILKEVNRKHDFSVEFYDEDSIRGRRRFKILSVSDMEPQLGNLNLRDVLLRKPKFKAPTDDKDKKDKDKDKDREGIQQHLLREQAELANSYLITPDAVIPFECPVKDDYGLTRAGYNFKVRKTDVELVSQGGGAKVPVMQIDQVTRRANAILVGSNFNSFLNTPLTPFHELGAFGLAQHDKAKDGFPSLFGARYYLAYTTAVLRESLNKTQGYREGHVPCEGFKDLLERKADKMIYLEQLKNPKTLQEILSRPAAAQEWQFDFNEDKGFDVFKQLPELKAVNVEQTGQQHYLLQIAVQAVDNNVETGKYRNEQGIIIGNMKSNRNGYVSFLVISENELLTQISLEEESISEKLESAKEKVDASIVSLKDQLAKVSDPKADMENVLNRMNEIRTAIAATKNILNDAEKAYDNIRNEMKVNRVRVDRISKIENKIYWPLHDINEQSKIDDPKNPTTGSMPFTEEYFDKAYKVVEDDLNARRQPRYAEHEEAMNDANRKLTKLSSDIKHILDAMSEGIVESKLVALLTAIERAQHERTKFIRDEHEKKIRDEIERLLNEGKEKDKSPNDDKKKSDKKEPGKQTSQLRVPTPTRSVSEVGPESSLTRRAGVADESVVSSDSARPRDLLHEQRPVIAAARVLELRLDASWLRQNTV